MTLSPTRARFLAAALLLTAFGAGVAVGVAADRLVPSPGGIRVQMKAGDPGLLDQLGLTGRQREQASAILERSAPRTRAVMLEVGERLQRVADSVDAELRAILTPEQRSRLDSLRVGRGLLLKRKVTGPDGDVKTDTILPRREP